MTTAEDRVDRSDDARSAVRPYGYRVPGELTRTARHAFHTEVRVFAAELANQTERVAQEAHCADPECTVDDVQAARRRLDRSAADGSGDHGLIGAGLLTVGTVGVGVLANYLHSPLQVVVFGVFVVMGVAGLLLTWAGRGAC